MKKIVTTIIFIGAISLFSMGIRPQSPEVSVSQGSTVSIEKGYVINCDRDRDWEGVTFGISGLDQTEYEIAYVEILDKKGGSIAKIDNIRMYRFDGDSYWYYVDLTYFRIRKDFTLVVHVISGIEPDSNTTSTFAAKKNAGGSPNDPDETILIVKYP
jgi:hypothetical protein